MKPCSVGLWIGGLESDLIRSFCVLLGKRDKYSRGYLVRFLTVWFRDVWGGRGGVVPLLPKEICYNLTAGSYIYIYK